MKFLYQDTSLVTDEQIQQTKVRLTDYTQHLKQVLESKNYDAPESSINLPFNEELLTLVKKVGREKVSPKLKYIIDVGIGGSNLGTKAVYDALFGYFDVIEPNRFPKIIFADTTDPEFLSKLSNFLSNITDPEEILINLISKSGGTTETIANGELILTSLNSQISNLKSHLVVTTDEGSKLWEWAVQNGVEKLPIPKNVGGRFSVFSAVGLFPLLACGINIDELREGAQLAIQQHSEKISDNPAALSAIILYLQNQQGKNINDNFIFHPELESLGKWYRQLMGESVGKEHNLNGDVVHTGITPTVSIGSTDLHSMGQLYLGGPNDKITTFIYSDQSKTLALPQTSYFQGLVSGINGKNVSGIMNAILAGTKIAYQKKGLAFTEIVLADISEKSLGEFLQFKMIEMMYLGKLLNVNTFDQPNVEDYKIETKKILNQ